MFLRIRLYFILLMTLPFGVWAQGGSLANLDSLNKRISPIEQLKASQDTANQNKIKLDSTQVKLSSDTVEYQSMDMIYDADLEQMELNRLAQIKFQSAVLNSDTIVYFFGKKQLSAIGNPILKEGKNPPLAGYRMKYNLTNKEGRILYGSVHQDRQQFNGMDIRRKADGRLLIARGDFSTCDTLPHQHYFFYSRRMLVEPKDYVVAKPVVLNIANVPVAMFPIFGNPLNKERRSGLLLPKYGGDAKQGFYLKDLGYYWAMNDYMDWDFKGDIIEGANANFDQNTFQSNYRYKKIYDLDGDVQFKAYLNELGRQGTDWDVHFAHNQNLTPDGKSTLKGEGSFVSNASVRQQQGIERQVILDQQANATLTWHKTFKNNASLNVSFKQDRNLNFSTPTTVGEMPTRKTIRTFPAVDYSVGGAIFAPSEEESFNPDREVPWYENLNYTYRFSGNRLERNTEDTITTHDTTWIGASDQWTVSYLMSAFKVINIRPNLSWQGDWSPYSYENAKDSNFTRRTDFEPSHNRYGNYFWRTQMGVSTDTKLYGIWKPEWDRFTGIRHTISPNISYTYAPEIDTNFNMVRHPVLHSTFAQNKQQTIGFNLGNDFDLKYIKSYEKDSTGDKPVYDNYKVLGISSGTSYNFEGKQKKWSNINSNLQLQAYPSYMMNVNFVHSFYHPFEADSLSVLRPQLQSWSTSFNKNWRLNGKMNSGVLDTSKMTWSPWSVGLDYSVGILSQRVASDVFSKTLTHSGSANASLNPTPEWDMTYRTTYDFNQGEFAEHRFEFKRRLHCWQIDFSWVPVGPAAGWSFNIFVIDLPDIKFPMVKKY